MSCNDARIAYAFGLARRALMCAPGEYRDALIREALLALRGLGDE